MQDSRTIARHSLRTWGSTQRERYLRAIDRRFSWLAENPGLGRPRADIKAGYHSYPQGVHLIFYLVREDGIDSIGVPDQRMDVEAYVSNE